MTKTAHHRFIRRGIVTAAVALAAAAVPLSGAAQPASSSARLLDVPYLPQSEALCGGAAIAMVMRYWGATGVYAETFADLVDATAGGIRGSELIRALDARGFDAVSFAGDAARVRSALDERLPLVALIEDRPGRFHYVVIVGWRGDRVIVHDPARAPFQVIGADAFTRAWAVSKFWTLAAQPKASASAASPSAAPTPSVASRPATSVCAGMVEEGIRLAGTGDLPGAERVLDLAAADCDRDPAPWRELAGIHALRTDWTSAARDARRALARDPTDQHAARILATSLFLLERDEEALDAWNRIGAPVVDIVDIRGLERTRFAVASATVDLPAQSVLTEGALARARRRLAALPSLMGSRVAYEPGEDDRAKVVAAVLERPLVPVGLIPVGSSLLRAATERELFVPIASPTGGGELWSVSWRWWERRPRAAVALAAPSPFGGVWSVEAFGERQTYGSPDTELTERRRGAVLRASDWITGTTEVEGGVSLDRWHPGSTATFHAGIRRVIGRRLTATLDAAGMAGTYRAGSVHASADWRSTDARAGSAWHARAGYSLAGSGAPLALWPGAGTGQGRDVLLRAHPLLHDGAIRGVFGRGLVHGGVEWRYWRGPVFKTLHVAPAVFVDAARALRPPAFGDGRAHADAGAGLRVSVPGAGVLRIDLAHGLRDGETTLSFGWMR